MDILVLIVVLFLIAFGLTFLVIFGYIGYIFIVATKREMQRRNEERDGK